jgi:hypothetical protein
MAVEEPRCSIVSLVAQTASTRLPPASVGEPGVNGGDAVAVKIPTLPLRDVEALVCFWVIANTAKYMNATTARNREK